jgi:Ca2+-binding RTX toxin-like protein
MTGSTDFTGLIAGIGLNIPDDETSAVGYLSSFGEFLNHLANDLESSPSQYDAALQKYFAQIGLSLSIGAIDHLHYVAKEYDGQGNVDFTYDSEGAIITGESGNNNFLIANGDLTQAIITNIQGLQTSNVTLTAAQLEGFSELFGGGTVQAATAGTYSLAGIVTTGEYDMVAAPAGDTTLIGDDADNQHLFASATGDDTLEAGGGTSDVLYAGGGKDTLIGGNGSTVFDLVTMPATGSVIQGGAGSNDLEVNGDISGLTISKVQTLQTSNVTLTAAQLEGFSELFGGGTVQAATAGTYSLAGIVTSGEYDMVAAPTGDTTLIGDDADNQHLFASATGDDTLEAGGGTSDVLYAGGGKDTLIGGSGVDRFDLGDGQATVLLGNTGSTVQGLKAGDAIGLEGQQVTSAIYDSASRLLAITSDTGSVFNLNITGDYQKNDFGVSNGEVVLCFVEDTGIATSRGEIPVEELTAGDLVQARFAGQASVVWIGHRQVDCRRHPKPQSVWPVRVRAGTFGPRLPRRDLWLSPDHAVFVDGVLIPIKHLVNGCTIMQVPLDEVTYFHIELEQHDVMLAEGLPAESLLPTGDRSAFSNGGGPVQLHPDFHSRAWEADGCAPLIVAGPALEAVRVRLLQRAAKLASGSRRDRKARKSRAA